MKFHPCIDIHDGKVKQIVGSTLSGKEAELVTNFQTDLSPAYYAEIYKNDNLTGGHVIMLGEGNDSAAIQALNAYPGGLQVGGGIRPQNASIYLDAGASHVIVTSYVFSEGKVQWERLAHLSQTVGKRKVVLDLSCKRKDGQYFVVTNRWQKFTELSLSSDTFGALADYCDQFLIHAADVEGKKEGIDEELVSLLAQYSPIPVTYAGGVNSINDLERIRDAGNFKIDVTVGSALDLFGGNLKYKDIIAWFHQNTH